MLHLEGGPVTDTEGEVKIVIDLESEAVQPLEDVTVTIYEPLDAGVIHVVEPPFDQTYEVKPEGTHNCRLSFVHPVDGPVIETVGEVTAVKDFESDAVHPSASVAVTEYDPVFTTLIQVVVPPPVHKYEENPEVAQS